MFKIFGDAVAKRFKDLSANQLFRVGADKNLLWEAYLMSFPEGSNPKYRERTEHDCNACKSFIRAVGGVVAIVDGKVQTIWEIDVPEPYASVARGLDVWVRASNIDNIFLTTEPVAGVKRSVVQVPDSTDVITWDHFFVNVPKACVVRPDEIGPKMNDARTTHDVLLRALTEISTESISTVLELIDQKSLYRGEEHQSTLLNFLKLKVDFLEAPIAARDLFAWQKATTVPQSVTRVRNTAIGSLLVDLSEGKEVEDAVKSFEAKVAPQNYKRPTAVVTKAMVDRAKAKVEELGLTSALERRFATIDDVSINNLIYADRSVKKAKNVFDEVKEAAPENLKSYDRVDPISVDDFVAKILPKAEKIEVMVENRHAPNFVSLIAPADPTARPLFKWANNFSWSYAGDLADSIRERVKRAGGSVTGDFRASLSWHNYDDLDLHLVEPGREEIHYAHRRSVNGGVLDVDMNAGSGKTREPVENITYAKRDQMPAGPYKLYVHQFSKRETKDVGFEVELEFCGDVKNFAFPKVVASQAKVVVAEFEYSRKDGVKILKSLPEASASKTIWGIQTQTFRKVDAIMFSPNHWDGRGVGNKHFFFMLEGAAHEGRTRGFFNEFLSEELNEHRKVLEIVGSKMLTDKSDRQLSGLGFSSTKRDHLLCRVTGAFERVVKIEF